MAQLANTPLDCLVYGCQNRSDQGTFIGPVCLPCHTMLTKGVESNAIRHGNTFIHVMFRQHQEMAGLIKQIRDSVSGTTWTPLRRGD